jgi:hypothetical protein
MTSTPAVRTAARALLLAGAAVVAYLMLSLLDEPARADAGGLDRGPGQATRPAATLPDRATEPPRGGRPPAATRVPSDDRALPVIGDLLGVVGDTSDRDGTPDRGGGQDGDRIPGPAGTGAGDGTPAPAAGDLGGDGESADRGDTADAARVREETAHHPRDLPGGVHTGPAVDLVSVAGPTTLDTADQPANGTDRMPPEGVDRPGPVAAIATLVRQPITSATAAPGLTPGNIAAVSGSAGDILVAATGGPGGVLAAAGVGPGGVLAAAGVGPGGVLVAASDTLAAAIRPLIETVRATVTAVTAAIPLEPVLRLVLATTGAALPTAPHQPDATPVPPASSPVPPPAAAPAVEASPADTAAPRPEAVTAVAGRSAGRSAGVAGPWGGATSSITTPPLRRDAIRGTAGGAAAPAPGSGLGGGCVPGGCAHTMDVITGAGQPLVMPAVLAVRPAAAGRLVAPAAGPDFAGRLPGVAPLPG